MSMPEEFDYENSPVWQWMKTQLSTCPIDQLPPLHTRSHMLVSIGLDIGVFLCNGMINQESAAVLAAMAAVATDEQLRDLFPSGKEN